jgi:hypothetical protein
MDTPQQRYVRDPQFHALVDTIYHAICQCKYTATEVREAAMLAAIIYDQRHAVPMQLTREQTDRWRATLSTETDGLGALY